LPARINAEIAAAAAQKALDASPVYGPRPIGRLSLVAALVELAERMKPADPPALTAAVAQMAVDSLLESDNSPNIKPSVAPALATAVAQMALDCQLESANSPDEKNTFRTLAAVLGDPAKLNDPSVVMEAVHKAIQANGRLRGPTFVKSLALLAPRLTPQAAVGAIRQVSEVMRGTSAPYSIHASDDPMIEAVALLARRVEPDQARAIVSALLQPVTQRPNPPSPPRRGIVSSLLGAMTRRPNPPSPRRPDPRSLLFHAKLAGVLAERMTPQDAADAFKQAVHALNAPDNSEAFEALIEVVTGLSRRLGPDDASIIRIAADRAVLAMIQDPSLVHVVLCRAVPTLAARLKPHEVESLAGASVAGAIEALAKVGYVARPTRLAYTPQYTPQEIKDLGEAARALAVQVKSGDAAGPLGRGLDAMSRKTNRELLWVLEVVLAALADRIEGEAAPALARRALSDMTGTADDSRPGPDPVGQRTAVLGSLGRTAARLAGRIEARAGAAVVVAAALRALASGDQFARGEEKEQLAPWRSEEMVIERAIPLSSPEIRAAAQQVLDAFPKWNSSEPAGPLGFVRGVKARGGHYELRKAVALLAARMDPAATGAVAGAAESLLLPLDFSVAQAHFGGPYDDDLLGSIEITAASVVRMSPLKAAATAKDMVRGICSTWREMARYPSQREMDLNGNLGFPFAAAAQRDFRLAFGDLVAQMQLRLAFGDLVAQMQPDDAAAAVQHAFETMGESGALYQSRGEVVEVLLTRCATAGLVELLKQPECVRGRRRAILREWANRQHRTFSNIWDFAAWVPGHDPYLDLKSPSRPFPAQDRP
jgi:hypothetical protein